MTPGQLEATVTRTDLHHVIPFQIPIPAPWTGTRLLHCNILRVSVDEFQFTQTFKTRVSKWDVKMDRMEQRAGSISLIIADAGSRSTTRFIAGLT
jgi:hypothetical protein